MNPMDKKRLIENYLNGELTADELEILKHEMKQDKRFASEVKLHNDIEEFLKDRDTLELRKILDEIHEEVTGNSRKQEKEIIHLFPKRWQNIAAAIFLLLALSSVLFFSLRPNRTYRLYAQYYKVYDASELVRGSTSEADDKFTQAMAAFDMEDYRAAYELLTKLCKQLLISDSNYSKANFYKGISAMEIENFDDAIISFEIVKKNKKSLYNEVAQWYQALCYLRKDDKDKAIELFNEISSGDSFYNTKAKEILDALNN